MSRKKILFLLGLVAVMTAAGCGKTETKEETQAPSAAASDTSADENDTEEPDNTDDEDADNADAENADTFSDDETEAETEAELDPITPSDYLIKDVSDYVTPGELTGLEVTQYNYEITDDLVQDEIDADLISYANENEVDRPSAEGDVVYTDMTYSIQGVEDSESSESTYFTIGDEEYGEEFDSKITGVSTGDTITFSITFGDDIWMDEWVNQTVDFELNITSVCEVEVPEYNDDFVTTYTDFSSTDEYEAAIRENLENEYNESSRYEAVEALFESAAEQTVFSGYPEDLYEQCRQEQLDFYSIFTGSTEEEDIYELFDMTAEDFEADVVDAVNRRLLVNAICIENGLDVTEDEYVAYLTELAEDYGYDSIVEFEQDNSRETLVWDLFDTKAGDYLYENAVITEETADFDDEDYWDEEDIELDEIELDETDLADEDVDLGEIDLPEETEA